MAIRKLNLPLDRRAVDALQEELTIMASDGRQSELLNAAQRLLAQSESAGRSYPRDAATLSDLGNLAANTAQDNEDTKGVK